MIVVSNTSPIFYLSSINQLDLLHQLYDEIVIPTAVLDEITNIGNTDISAAIVPTLNWIKSQSVIDRAYVNRLISQLDRGEAEAIVLAIELNANRLLMDERLGRLVAIKLGLQVTGVLGVLIAAKRQNLIQNVKPLLDGLIEQAGFWIDEQLYAEVLQTVDEISL